MKKFCIGTPKILINGGKLLLTVCERLNARQIHGERLKLHEVLFGDIGRLCVLLKEIIRKSKKNFSKILAPAFEQTLIVAGFAKIR